jgi:hypothetical protein
MIHAYTADISDCGCLYQQQARSGNATERCDACCWLLTRQHDVCLHSGAGPGRLDFPTLQTEARRSAGCSVWCVPCDMRGEAGLLQLHASAELDAPYSDGYYNDAIIGVVVDPCSVHLKALGQNKCAECIRPINNVCSQMTVRYLTKTRLDLMRNHAGSYRYRPLKQFK